LFVGNLPYQATEEDLRTHFGQVGPPTQIVRPLDRETGRARGFAFVEFADRALAEAAIKRFDGQLFMGRPLAVSEARAREDRGPGGPRPGGGFSPRPPGAGFGARPGGGPGFGGPRYGSPGEGAGGGTASRDRNFGPPAPPKGSKKGPKAGFKKDENRPRGPIPTKFTGRMYDLDEVNEEDTADDATPEFMKPDEAEVVDEPKDEGKEE
jgi:RNA recognition motif-containing protein